MGVKVRAFIVVLIMTVAYLGYGTEIDFTQRDERLKDSTKELNALMNHYLRTSVEAANKWGRCDGEAFRDDLHKRVGGIFWSKFEDDIKKNPSIDKRTTTRARSIFRDISFFTAPALFLANFGDLLRIGSYFVGSDKLGHFIEEGYNYYRIIHRERRSLKDALAFGERAESGHFGLLTTGIYSSADLAANYQGYNEFWRVLMDAIDPFVSCQKGVYKINRTFDVANHVNYSWDEAYNCSSYRNKEMNATIANNIALLEKKKQTRFACPIEPEKCASMIKQFGDVASAVITKKCFEVAQAGK